MQLKVLTLNIHKGISVTQSKLTLFDIQACLNDSDADLIFLQEVQGEHDKNQDKFADWPQQPQTEFLAGEKWPYFHYGMNHSHKHGHHGNAILSKFPLAKAENVDISASRFSDRGLLYARIDHFGTPLHLICTHLGLLNKERENQFDALRDFICENTDKSEALILAGDFNDWQVKFPESLSNELELEEVFMKIQGHVAKSFPAELPLLKVDRIYYRGLKPLACEVLSSHRVSDHLPLVAQFEFENA